MTTILMSASEPSGDALGAAIMRAIRLQRPDATFIGGGGPAMRAEGLDQPVPTDSLAVMGPVDALAALPRARRLSHQLAELAATRAPQAAILIDSWTFSRMAADAIRRANRDCRLVKLAAPQVWASRPGRAKGAAALFDLILCLLPFEPPYFEREGGRALFIGNPNFQDTNCRARSGAAFRSRHDVDERPLLLLLPGSRMGEVERLMPVYGEALACAAERVRGLKGVIVAAPAVEARVRALAATWASDPLVLGNEEKFDAFDAADVALAASGTVTTELAITGTPMVVAYRVGAITAFWARRVLTTPYVTVLNVAAGEEIIPERLQGDCMPAQLCADVVRLFDDEEERRKQLSAFRRLLPRLLGRDDPARVAAAAVLALVDGEERRDLDGRAAGQ